MMFPLPTSTAEPVRCRNPLCRRWLRDPESVALGYGPDCAEARGLIPPRRPRWPVVHGEAADTDLTLFDLININRQGESMSIIDNARQELTRAGEEPETIDAYCDVLRLFFDHFDSGGAALAAWPVLTDLFYGRALSPLTDDPAEWMHIGAQGDGQVWQSLRTAQAFSEDCGKTYYLLDERDAAGSLEATPRHATLPIGQPA